MVLEMNGIPIFSLNEWKNVVPDDWRGPAPNLSVSTHAVFWQQSLAERHIFPSHLTSDWPSCPEFYRLWGSEIYSFVHFWGVGYQIIFQYCFKFLQDVLRKQVQSGTYCSRNPAQVDRRRCGEKRKKKEWEERHVAWQRYSLMEWMEGSKFDAECLWLPDRVMRCYDSLTELRYRVLSAWGVNWSIGSCAPVLPVHLLMFRTTTSAKVSL